MACRGAAAGTAHLQVAQKEKRKEHTAKWREEADELGGLFQ